MHNLNPHFLQEKSEANSCFIWECAEVISTCLLLCELIRCDFQCYIGEVAQDKMIDDPMLCFSNCSKQHKGLQFHNRTGVMFPSNCHRNLKKLFKCGKKKREKNKIAEYVCFSLLVWSESARLCRA